MIGSSQNLLSVFESMYVGFSESVLRGVMRGCSVHNILQGRIAGLQVKEVPECWETTTDVPGHSTVRFGGFDRNGSKMLKVLHYLG